MERMERVEKVCSQPGSRRALKVPQFHSLGAKTIKKKNNLTQNKSQTQRANAYEVTSFQSIDCELSTATCSQNVYNRTLVTSFWDSWRFSSWRCQILHLLTVTWWLRVMTFYDPILNKDVWHTLFTSDATRKHRVFICIVPLGALSS